MLRHASYRQDHPTLSVVRDLTRVALRPSRLVLAAFLLAVAAKTGAPVHRVIPAPVKAAYADVAQWRSDQDAAAQCISGRTKALRSGSPQHFIDAERRCAEAAARRAR